MRKSAAAIFLLVLITGCGRDGSTENVVVIPKGADGTNSPVTGKAAIPAGLAETKKICTQCHASPNPSQHHPAAWPSIVARMEGHIRTNGRIMPSPSEREAILGYLQGGWQK